MTNKERVNKIIDKIESAGWETLIADYQHRTITAQRGYSKINISFELCMCHGSRITISEGNHSQSNYRIEHACYDSSVGVVDEESEFNFEVENELLSVISQFDHYTYKCCIINEYGQNNGRDQERVSYHKSLDDAFRVLGVKSGTDPLTFEQEIINYPNPTCHLKITRIYKEVKYSWDNNKIWFECERTGDDWKTSNKYEAYLSFFEKR